MSVVLGTKARPNAKTFAANVAANRALLDDLHEQLALARAGGGPAAAERHVARGKLLARERV
ncbi:MAG: 3-methylcrotonyl-CoA carboxylase beta subunit, partial [Solirubrobacteraceae bacterium]|nr:3-methylcrotonyl-CoA carboxylase beta subunit [Solirubrobacteraceae bacterium]